MRRAVTSPPKSSQDGLGKWLARWRNAVVREEVLRPFLDVACGHNLLAATDPRGFGVDVVNHGGADFIVGDFCHLPLRRGAFRCVTIVASLNYFDRPEQVLAECARVLDPDGVIVVTLLGPVTGRLWHLFRESWAKAPGLSSKELARQGTLAGLRLERHRRFMLGLNNLYVLGKR